MTKDKSVRLAIQELYYWQRNDDASNFTALLYTLMTKADIGNRARLASAFPNQDMAFRLWHDAPDEDEFFRDWLGDGVMRKRAL